MEVLDLRCGNSGSWITRLYWKLSQCSCLVPKVNIIDGEKLLCAVNRELEYALRKYCQTLISTKSWSNICSSMHNIFNHLLASLCIGDLLFLLCNLLLVPIAFGVDNAVTKVIYPIAECG